MIRRPYKRPILPDDFTESRPILPGHFTGDESRDSITPQPIPKKKKVKVEYDPAVHPLVVSYLRRDGADDAEIAHVIGVPVVTLLAWCRIDAEFEKMWKTSKLGICEKVVVALMKSALGQELKDVERMYEIRLNPVTRKKERVLVREKETIKRTLPNPLACFFYLQNRDAARWSQTGAKGSQGAQYTPEQISTMMRTAGRAISEATLGEGLSNNLV